MLENIQQSLDGIEAGAQSQLRIAHARKMKNKYIRIKVMKKLIRRTSVWIVNDPGRPEHIYRKRNKCLIIVVVDHTKSIEPLQEKLNTNPNHLRKMINLTRVM